VRGNRKGGQNGGEKGAQKGGGADSISDPRGNKANSLSKCMTSLKSLAENINKMKVDG